MDEILLTDDEIHDEMDTLDGAWTFRDICRAQVAKVVEWLESSDFRAKELILQALKQAAGEGK